MISTFICLHCGKQVPPNPRIKKGQKYCGAKECQRARKRLTSKTGSAITPEGLALRKARNKRWRESHPAYKYQKLYRSTHPEYVQENKEQQRLRNMKRQTFYPYNVSQKIVKTGALTGYPCESGVYALMPVQEGKIVKTDALQVQMQVLTGPEMFFEPKPF